MKCRHTSATWSEWHDGAWEIRGRLSGTPLEPHARFFKGRLVCACGHWLSLGHSDESPAKVAVEIRAAELVCIDRLGALIGQPRLMFDAMNSWEYIGVIAHDQPGALSFAAPANDSEWAGYLAAAIKAHDATHSEGVSE